ncbi:YdiU family protein [Gracilibacillus oryzae]|uniref:Protein nucleotidyltransferase YdiU n=1 Tax=Gracilibacillus oryzae TaxID=1672701 RepID=A0A7C8GS57_9BACI|nr:YdiU family protein [Gracilibacillus oryzae]KAB8129699.1 YdiU family protein [Gracilibacillus oryzae]
MSEVGFNFENSYTSLPERFYSKTEPNPVSDPALRVFNEELAEQLGFNTDELIKDSNVDILSGNTIPDNGLSIAQAYAGHQFGNFTMLGDGRAILLGEHVTPTGEKFDIQLKGSGITPYSRGGDGRATLGPMLREYIISEAMDALRIPTSRSLAVVTTGEEVMRETALPGAILTRIASSHIRFGTFQYAAAFGEEGDVKELADYTIKRHYPELAENDKPYLALLQEVVKRQGTLIAQWQLVGFIHGVMNTDNMTVSGETIDYGPCAFMDEYDPATVFSSIDRQGRYAYGNQPNITGWNLARFAETLLPLLDQDEDKAVELAQDAIAQFPEHFHQHWLQGMRAKLGIFNQETEDGDLIKELLDLMQQYEADFTNTFKALTFDEMNSMVMFGTEDFQQWKEKWKNRLERQEESMSLSIELMQNNNPAVIPRNHRVEEAIDAAVGNNDFSVLTDLLNVLLRPFDHSKDQREYASLPPKTQRPQQTFCGT